MFQNVEGPCICAEILDNQNMFSLKSVKQSNTFSLKSDINVFPGYVFHPTC